MPSDTSVPTDGDASTRYPWTGLVDLADVTITAARFTARDWYDGQWSALYAFQSTGTILSGLLGEALAAAEAADAMPDLSAEAYADVLALGAFAQMADEAWNAEHPDAEDYPSVLYAAGAWELHDPRGGCA